MGQIRKFFAGGITPGGFHSFFHEIIRHDARLIYILKGGPGTGKSTLMYKIANEMLERGFDIEQFHCSSDTDSIDGLSIPALDVAIVDGTAPHVIEPQYPGCVDRIINLGEYWDAKELQQKRDHIIELTHQNKSCYPRAYRYLRAAQELYKDTCQINQSCMDFNQVNIIITDLLDEVFGQKKKTKKQGKVRHLFATAFAPQGRVTLIDSIVEGLQNHFIIIGEPGTGRNLIMEQILNYAIQQGYNAEVFHSLIDPTEIEHLTLPELGVALISSHPPHPYESPYGTVINVNNYLDQNARSNYQYTLHRNFVIFEDLIELVLKQLRHGKSLHDQLEAIYLDCMDFSKFDQLEADIISEILAE